MKMDKAVSFGLMAIIALILSGCPVTDSNDSKKNNTITPSGSVFAFAKGQSISPITITTTPPDMSGSYSVSPSLPAGLSIDAASGSISGTPTTFQKSESYTVSFTGDGDFSNVTATSNISIEVIDASITPSSQSYNFARDNTISPITFTKTPADMSGSFSVSPTLPVGLSIDAASGSISGAPTTVQEAKSYTVSFKANGRYSGVIVTASFSIEIPTRHMVRVEGGSFDMGSTSGEENDERPVRRVTVSSYYISKYEVTQKLYEELMATNPSDTSRGIGDTNPVNKVSWNEAVAFCNALSTKDGLNPVYTISGSTVSADWSANGYRLPTEAEWEYAARGGKESQDYTYAGSNSVGEVAWYKDNSGSKTHPVGGKKENELGLYDMSGNVWEWVWDWYGTYPSSDQSNPRGPASGLRRVRRGGGWSNNASYTRSAYRLSDVPGNSDNELGFRLLRPIVQ